MCGISGFIDFNKTSSEHILKEMSDTLAHRGPDSDGISFFNAIFGQVGLAHRRLSVIDLSEQGIQPMSFEHYHITFNGEIYNFKEIKGSLQDIGHTFKNNTDTEVILHAFSEWGIECVHRFIGMFAFTIYDELRQEITCVRDRAGVKPFFYYWHQNLFLFSSELKAFHLHPGFIKQLNENAIPEFLQSGCISSPHTIFKNCSKLKPAHHLTLCLKTKKFQIHEYWNVTHYYRKPKTKISFNEAKAETEKLLLSAAEYRMVSDVPVGIFLSGGYDSTLLTALLQRDRKERLKTFTIGVYDEKLNEASFAKEIARYLGTDHTEHYCSEKEALEIVNLLPFFYDEPFGDQSSIATMLVSKIAKQSVKVALSADGGDETFAGYNRYDYMMKQGMLLNHIPKTLRNAAAKLLKKDSFNLKYKKLGSLLADPSPSNYITNLGIQFSEKDLNNLFIREMNYTFNSPHNILPEDDFTRLSYMMAWDYQTYLADDILQKVDRASMSQSLEAREPFLDHRIIEWVAQLPDEFKYHNGIKKHILKEITYKYVPEFFLNRPKMGFAVPMQQWLRHDLKDAVQFYLSAKRLEEQNIFNPSYIQKLVKEFYIGEKKHATKIWYLLVFQMWHEKWMK